MSGGEMLGAATRSGRSTTDELLTQTVRLAAELRGALLQPAVAGRGTGLRRLQQVAKGGELTALLGYCVAWLLVRKAVETGELSAEEGRADERRLGTMPALPLGGPDLAAAVGPQLAALDQRARALHARLARLDRLLDAPG